MLYKRWTDRQLLGVGTDSLMWGLESRLFLLIPNLIVLPTEKCPKPSWASALRFEPDKMYYSREEPVTLSCPEGFEPSHPVITCTGQGNRSVWNETAACLGKCGPPTWVTVIPRAWTGAGCSVTLRYCREEGIAIPDQSNGPAQAFGDVPYRARGR